MEYLEEQRDLYKFIHDETLRLACHGYNAEECAERLRLPEKLAKKVRCLRRFFGYVSGSDSSSSYSLSLFFSSSQRRRAGKKK